VPSLSPPDRPGRVLVTGATGFIGRAVAAALTRAGHAVVRGGRAAPASAPAGETWIGYGDIGPDTRWDQALTDIDVVVHTAGLAHQPDAAPASAAPGQFELVNVEGTSRLAAAAAKAGVRRLVLVSSALVQGPSSPGRPFTEEDPPTPNGVYARSKLASETRLLEAARDSAMAWVILRPPMVYGPGAGGNFPRLVKLVRTGLPLPLGAATAAKSFVGIDNLVDAIVRCVSHPQAANQLFLVCDAETTSTADLVRRLARALDRRVWLPHVPPALVGRLLRIAGRERDFGRLFEPLALDATRIRTRLGWSPPLSLDEGLRRAVAVYDD